MPRRVFYRISDRSDGLFDAITTIEPDTVIRRDGFCSLAEAEAWVDGLRVLMAALGAPVAQADDVKNLAVETVPEDSAGCEGLRTARESASADQASAIGRSRARPVGTPS